MAYIKVDVSHHGPILKYVTGEITIRKDKREILTLYNQEDEKETNEINLNLIGEYKLIIHQLTNREDKINGVCWTIGRYKDEVYLSWEKNEDYNDDGESIRWLKSTVNLFARTPTTLDFRAVCGGGTIADVVECEFFLELYYNS